MQLFYNFSISLYGLIIRIVALFNEKARKWVDGRKDLLSTIPNNINGDIVINWFHCASLGEFEQGRPLIENLRVISLMRKFC
jgi:3-deoxy-D-manno-octulosonic-acid transferase